ncbi:protein GRIP-like [Carica papaya]|uniref:protein GRIP-like n=1 Tax=Carica papaya TaxID=3649 RepID=UPI000B8CCB21|nr:protein GRIP-like [Carica papaya]
MDFSKLKLSPVALLLDHYSKPIDAAKAHASLPTSQKNMSDGCGDKHYAYLDHIKNGTWAKENGLNDSIPYSEGSHDQLLQLVVELKLQNEVLKYQFNGLKNLQAEHTRALPKSVAGGEERGDSVEVKDLLEKVESLSRELQEEKQTRTAAEEALKHLREAHPEADAKVQELSTKLAEAQQKLDQEIIEREDKYADLDSKFSRLHKQARQRIQDIQKEKDDLEARFHEVNEAAERASSQQSTLQQELERTRQQANEALKAMDVERQQVRSRNNKFRDNIEELRLTAT